MKLYVAQLAAWVLNEAVRSGNTNWFVLDGFRVTDGTPDTSRPRLDTMDFLIALSDKITSGTYVERCRLILTGFNRALLTVDPGKLDEELLGPCTPAEISACVREALSIDGLVIPVEKLEPFVTNDLPTGSARMTELNSRLRLLVHAVSRVREILPAATATDLADWLVEMLTDLPGGDDGSSELRRRLDVLATEVEEEGA